MTWTDEDKKQQSGFEVVNFGQAPWQVVQNDVSVTVGNQAVTRAIALDMNGVPRGDVPVQRDGAKVTFQMPRDGMYVVLR